MNKWAVIAIVVITMIIYLPVINGLKDAFLNTNNQFTLGTLSNILSKNNIRRSLWITTIQALTSTLIALLIGSLLAVIMVSTSIPGEKLFHIVGFTAFMAPPMIVVTGFLDLYGEYGFLSSIIPQLGVLGKGLTGIIAAHVFYNIPLAFSFVYSALIGVPREIIHTVILFSGGKVKYIIKKIIIPYISPAIISSGLIIFIYCFTSFAIPLSIGGIYYSTLEVYIYRYYKISFQPNNAAAIAFIQYLILQLIVLIIIAMYRREKIMAAPITAYKYPFKISRIAYFLGIIYSYAVLFYLLLPLIIIPIYGFVNPYTNRLDIDAWTHLLNPTYDPGIGVSIGQIYINTFYYALMTLVLGVSISLFIAVASPRTVDVIYLSLLAISPLTLSYGLLRSYGGILPVPLIIVLAHITATLPLATRLLRIGYYRIPRIILDSARVIGERGIPYIFRVLIPLMKPSLVTASLLAIIISIGEFSATYFIATSNYYTISPTIHVLRSLRKWEEADALATLLLIITASIVALVRGRIESWRMQ